MPQRDWSDDDELMRDLAEAIRQPDVDEAVLDTARMAFAWRTVDADLELAELRYDSSADNGALVRGPQGGSPRTLVFRGERLGVEIELTETGIEGQLIPPEPGEVRLTPAAGTPLTTTADDVGCFTFPARRRGPIRIEGSLAGGRFATQWISA
jgi:hypothetical protein